MATRSVAQGTKPGAAAAGSAHSFVASYAPCPAVGAVGSPSLVDIWKLMPQVG